MNTIKDAINNLLAGNNYIWAAVALLVILIAFIGFIADRANKRRKASNLKESNNVVQNNPVVEENNGNVVEPTTLTATPVVEPETISMLGDDVKPATIQDTMAMPEEEPKDTIVDQPINNVVNDQPINNVMNAQPINNVINDQPSNLNNNEPYVSTPNVISTPESVNAINNNPTPDLGLNSSTVTMPESMVGLGEAQEAIKSEEPVSMNMEEPINMSMEEPQADSKDDDVELLS